MENSRMIKKRKTKILCILHKIDFESMENQHIHRFIVQSNQLDQGLALYEVEQKVLTYNKLIPNEFLISIAGYYIGKKQIISTIQYDDFTLELVKQKLKEAN